MIEVLELRKSYGERHVLRRVNLRVDQGEAVALIGPSGGGKSTLLRCINGLESFQGGEIRVQEFVLRGGAAAAGGPSPNRLQADLLRQVRLRVGLVFQAFHLFPHLSILDNVALGPREVLGLKGKEAEERARTLLHRMGLADHAFDSPRSLSGGQQQRVAIARALAMEPRALLFDEPTSSLDPELVGEVLKVMAELVADGYALLIVTHHMPFAQRVAQRVAVLDEGTILEEGPSDSVFSCPRSERTRQFLQGLLA
ncbi:MAG: amino acid ABC transporter ATP-binding protein [Acidobacteria bacterium]|nr:amino acid ABC transporter ATP-binding protein [Acidobacteriota bacterium]